MRDRRDEQEQLDLLDELAALEEGFDGWAGVFAPADDEGAGSSGASHGLTPRVSLPLPAAGEKPRV